MDKPGKKPMLAVKIEKGVPIPSKKSRKYTAIPWRSMKRGDSFFHAGDASDIQSIRNHLNAVALRNKAKFTTRTVTENDVRGIRVWRVM